MKIKNIRGHGVWTDPLTAGSVVVDAGAHSGEFSDAIIAGYGCRCHLVEANPKLAAAIDASAGKQVISAALTDRDGRGTFHFDDNPESGSLIDSTHRRHTADTPSATEVELLSLGTLIARIGSDRIDLLKLDIEGAEFPLFDHTPADVLGKIGQITVEFHDFMPHFAGRGLYEKARARLEGLGFLCCAMSLMTHGNVLFVNQRQTPLNLPQRVYARHVARPLAKVREVLFRTAGA